MLVRGSLCIAGGQAPTRLEPLEPPLHRSAPSGQGASPRARAGCAALARDGATAPGLPPVLAGRPPAVPLLADPPAWAPCGPPGSWPLTRARLPQGDQERRLLPRSWRQEPAAGRAVALGPPVDGGAEAAPAAASRVGGGAPCVAPAAGWGARMMGRSTPGLRQSSRPSASAGGVRGAQRCCQTPARGQRSKRRATGRQGPSRAGRSRQGAPVRRSPRRPWRRIRWAGAGRPRRGVWGGSTGGSRSHGAFVTSPRFIRHRLPRTVDFASTP